MTTQEVAARLNELCKKAEFKKAQEELYSDDATSTESNMQGMRETIKGRQGIIAKGEHFQQQIEAVHGSSVGEPTVFGNYIFFEMTLDATMKGMGRVNMVEMCRYEVKNGKVISEEFYY